MLTKLENNNDIFGDAVAKNENVIQEEDEEEEIGEEEEEVN